MLIQFTVGNYRSFKDPVTLSMVAARISSKDKEIDADNVFVVDDNLSLLTSAAIYGANASGKSNLVAAIRFMRQFVLSSSRDSQAGDAIPVERYRLSSETDDQPSHFEMVFLLQGKRYRYGFEVTTEAVTAEWLYHVPTTREARLFVREGDDFTVSPGFREGRGLADRTRPNALFLSVVAQFNGELATAILLWFLRMNNHTGIDNRLEGLGTILELRDSRRREEIVTFVKKLDLGIDDIEVETTAVTLPRDLDNMPYKSERDMETPRRFVVHWFEEVVQAKAVHWKYDDQGRRISREIFDIDRDESAGTKRLLALSSPILEALRDGRVIVVDELDARLHPLITCEIIKLFNSRATNPHRAQLIFTTHDTNLLSSELFRRDQIWFTEKSAQGATALYSLVEYRLDNNAKVRNDASYEKNYIEGRYGAIPFIGDLQRLIVGNGDAEQ